MSQPISCDGEAHVLAAAADGERELLVGHHDFDALGQLVEHDLGDVGRLQRRDHEVGDVFGPGDDVDLFALELADHRLDARAAHTDAGADGIDRASPTRSPRSWREMPGSRAIERMVMMPS